jgi:hypothetical protein
MVTEASVDFAVKKISFRITLKISMENVMDNVCSKDICLINSLVYMIQCNYYVRSTFQIHAQAAYRSVAFRR